MLQQLLEFFNEPKPETRLGGDDMALALSALLVRIARADEDYASVERRQILAILAQRFGTTGAAAEALLKEAEELEAQAPDTVRFTRAIKDGVPYDERTGVVEAMWSVALADGGRDAEEDGFIRLAANLLGVNDRDSGLARQRMMRPATGND